MRIHKLLLTLVLATSYAKGLHAEGLKIVRNKDTKVAKIILPTGQQIQYVRSTDGHIQGKIFTNFKYTLPSSINSTLARAASTSKPANQINAYHPVGTPLYNFGLINELVDRARALSKHNIDAFAAFASQNAYSSETKQLLRDYFLAFVTSAVPQSSIYSSFVSLDQSIESSKTLPNAAIEKYFDFFFTKKNDFQIYKQFKLRSLYGDLVSVPSPDWWGSFAETIQKKNCSGLALAWLNEYQYKFKFSAKGVNNDQNYIMKVDSVIDGAHILIDGKSFYGLGDRRNDESIFSQRNKDINYKSVYLGDANFDMVKNLAEFDFPIRQFEVIHEIVHNIQDQMKALEDSDATVFLSDALKTFLKYNEKKLSSKQLQLGYKLATQIATTFNLDSKNQTPNSKAKEYGAEISALDILIDCM